MTAGFVIAVTAVVVVGLACGAWRAVSTGEPAAGEGHWRGVRSGPGPGLGPRRGQGWPRGSFRDYPARRSPGYPARQYPRSSSRNGQTRNGQTRNGQTRSGQRRSKSRFSRRRAPRGGLFQASTLIKRSPLVDRRDRHGFASARQLRQEASVAAARRRAAQTRPSLRKNKRRLQPEEIGYPLGRAHPGGMPLWPSWEASLRLVAPPGEGKTFRALVPVLRQHPGPAIATSTKADLYELTAIARAKRGPVFALDPDLLAPAAEPARWSPVTGCEQSEVAERRAAALVAATGDDNDTQNGTFFRDSARDLLKAYLHAAALEGLDIRAVLDWSRRPEDPSPAEVLLSSPSAAAGWGDLVGLHTTGSPETTSGVLRYVARALACFSHDAVIEACCPEPGEALDIEQFLIDNGTIYLLGKGSRLGAVAPLITAFADEVFDCAERLAATMPNRRLDPPLLGLLDEAPSIAPVPSLPELLADGRGRGIVLVYAMQSFSQAVTRWGAAAGRDDGQCDVHYSRARWPHVPDRSRRPGKDLRPTASAPGLHPPWDRGEERPGSFTDHQLGKRSRLAGRPDPHSPGRYGSRALEQVATGTGPFAIAF